MPTRSVTSARLISEGVVNMLVAAFAFAVMTCS